MSVLHKAMPESPRPYAFEAGRPFWVESSTSCKPATPSRKSERNVAAEHHSFFQCSCTALQRSCMKQLQCFIWPKGRKYEQPSVVEVAPVLSGRSKYPACRALCKMKRVHAVEPAEPCASSPLSFSYAGAVQKYPPAAGRVIVESSSTSNIALPETLRGPPGIATGQGSKSHSHNRYVT